MQLAKQSCTMQSVMDFILETTLIRTYAVGGEKRINIKYIVLATRLERNN